MDEQRVVELSHGAVLGTLAGARARVGNLPLADLMLLLDYYGCELDRLHHKLWGVERLFHELQRADRARKRAGPPGP